MSAEEMVRHRVVAACLIDGHGCDVEHLQNLVDTTLRWMAFASGHEIKVLTVDVKPIKLVASVEDDAPPRVSGGVAYSRDELAARRKRGRRS